MVARMEIATSIALYLCYALAVIVPVNGGSNDICPYITSCNPGGTTCGCNEVDSNCTHCSEGYGCTTCNDGYFRPDSSTQCISCEIIDHCDSCQNDVGCIECHDGCSLLQATECDIISCRCGNFNTPFPTSKPSSVPSNEPSNAPSNDPTNVPSKNPSDYPTNKPTNYPTDNPSNYPSMGPTEQSLECYFNDLFSNNILSNPNATLTDFASDAISNLYGIAHGNARQVYKQFIVGICDQGVFSVRKDFIEFIDGKAVTHIFYNACFSSINGLFWLNGRHVNTFDENDLIKEITIFFFDETDVEYIKQYGESRSDIV